MIGKVSLGRSLRGPRFYHRFELGSTPTELKVTVAWVPSTCLDLCSFGTGYDDALPPSGNRNVNLRVKRVCGELVSRRAKIFEDGVQPIENRSSLRGFAIPLESYVSKYPLVSLCDERGPLQMQVERESNMYVGCMYEDCLCTHVGGSNG